MSVHVLYGVADRDPNELVCMFFPNEEDMNEFLPVLPGNYRYLVLEGIAYDDFEIGDDVVYGRALPEQGEPFPEDEADLGNYAKSATPEKFEQLTLFDATEYEDKPKSFVCRVEMDFEADTAEEAERLMEQAMRQGDVVIEVTP